MSEIAISPNEIRRIVAYCAEEVRRQQDGPLNVGYMVDAWLNALEHQYHGDELSLDMVEHWGVLIEPNDNADGFRGGNVWIGGRIAPRPDEIAHLLDRWINLLPSMEPLEAYREFEWCHPFFDGNGRTGKVILNYLNGTMLDPIFPPKDLFGEPIENP